MVTSTLRVLASLGAVAFGSTAAASEAAAPARDGPAATPGFAARPAAPVSGATEGAGLDRVMNAADRRHLLLRSGIGAAPADLLALEGLTRAEGIARVVDGLRVEPGSPMPPWTRAPPPHYHALPDMSDAARRRFGRARDRELAELRGWWVDEMLGTDSPQTERLVFFWHDLFATSYHGTHRASLAMARQNATFRRLATGSWQALLSAMLADAALLDFLDAADNRAAAPNENLAREFLELFTLGEGHYTQRDVTETARALTGRATSDNATLAFSLQTWHQDTGDKTIFGERGPHDGDALVRLVLDQPSSTRHLATRFWQAFVADGVPDGDWLDAVSARFRASRHEIGTLYRDTLSSAAFWAPRNRGAIVRSPLDLVIGTARSLDYPKRDPSGFARVLADLGMDLFAPPDVGGWREGEAFVTGGALLDRRRAIERIVRPPDEVGAGAGAASMADGMSGDGMMADAGSADDPVVGASMAAAESAGGRVAGGTTAGGRPIDGPEVGESPDTVLEIRLAAEHYRGAAAWRVSLRADGETLWADHARVLDGAHDTELDGRLDGAAEMPWRRVRIPAPADALVRADAVVVEFLSDFAGPEGDRNLYVDGALLGGDWLAAADGVQRSDCVPENPLDAGALYCAGTLVLTRASPSSPPSSAASRWSAEAAHVRWANAVDGEYARHAVAIALDDARTPVGAFHRLQFRVVAFEHGPVELEIESFDCVPDCIDDWPDCAWGNARFAPSRLLSFPLDGRPASAREPCHIESVSADERALVAALGRSARSLLERLAGQPSGRLHEATLGAVREALAAVDPGTGDIFAVADRERPPVATPPPTRAPPAVRAATPEVLLDALAAGGLELADVMLAGLPDAALAPLAPRPGDTAAAAIRRVARHPAFQVR